MCLVIQLESYFPYKIDLYLGTKQDYFGIKRVQNSHWYQGCIMSTSTGTKNKRLF